MKKSNCEIAGKAGRALLSAALAATVCASAPLAAFADQEAARGTNANGYANTARDFWDVDPASWYADSVAYCAEQGIISGYTDADGEPTRIFGVNETLTRAQLAVILWRYYEPDQAANYDASREAALGATSAAVTEQAADGSEVKRVVALKGIADREYYTAAANWAVENGIVNGFALDDGSRDFAPDAKVSFEQLISIIVNASGADADSIGTDALSRFSDADAVSDWARKPMALAAMAGLVNGYGNADGTRSLAPGEDVSRARAACVLASYLKSPDLTHEHTWADLTERQWIANPVEVVVQEAYDEPVYGKLKYEVCLFPGCGYKELIRCDGVKDQEAGDRFSEHFGSAHLDENGIILDGIACTYEEEKGIVRYTHHDAVTETQDRGSWQDVVVGRVCTQCGAKETA
jgi:hypothetical protein